MAPCRHLIPNGFQGLKVLGLCQTGDGDAWAGKPYSIVKTISKACSERQGSTVILWELSFLFHLTSIYIFMGVGRAAPVVYRSSQARGGIVASAAGLHHSHGITGSEPSL